MILTRLSRAVREQNWFAVVLEFVIVIAGVVIGFQITGWNEARMERASEALALARIQDDVVQNLRELDARIRSDQSRNQDNRIMVAAVTTGSLAPEDAGAFQTAVEQLLFFSRPPISQPSYDALEQSGDLTVISNDDLLRRLAELRSDLAWVESQHSSFRTGLSAIAPTWRPYVFHRATSQLQRTTVQVDLEALASDPEAVSAVVEATRMHAIFASYIERYTDDLRSFCAELAAITGNACVQNEEVIP